MNYEFDDIEIRPEHNRLVRVTTNLINVCKICKIINNKLFFI